MRRFDTILVETRGNGVAGLGGLKDIQVARLRAIFRVPASLERGLFGADRDPPAHLGLVEWFSAPSRRDPDSALYKTSRQFTSRKEVKLGVIEIMDVRRSCQLLPCFGPEPVDRRITSHTVLDLVNDFLLNDMNDKHAYRTIY
ncbi:hypothetical protein AURDEDRAFT_164664 [Auricularia subglabra TFB-10046 SS5]|nr:hypothetical protein AURDEDRAFT_164664 [Auricularia subglabra TFB-10046 SS5]